MKNKGFTLIETLATLIILSILFMIAVPSITTLVNKVNENRIKEDAETFIQLAKHYVEKHIEFEVESDETEYLYLTKDCDDNKCIDMNKLSDEYEEGREEPADPSVPEGPKEQEGSYVTISDCEFNDTDVYECAYSVNLTNNKLTATGGEGNISVQK